ncbi:MAG: glycosyltransferase family 39 protein [Chloroflexi bacterium]|nr:glycosyltransferase family 39 protein [Chloroflexota bacterium]
MVQPQSGALLSACLGLALVAQYLLDGRRSMALAGGLYAAAALLFILLFHHEPLEAEETSVGRGGKYPASKGAHRIRWLFVALSVPLGALAFPRFQGNLFRREGTLLWLAGLALLALASRPLAGHDRRRDDAPRITREGLLLERRHLALLGIMAIGAFYRLHKIGTIPQEMGCDLPHIYNNIRLLLRSEFLIFFPSHPGREGLFFYLATPLAKTFGLSHTTIKVASALVGVLTLPTIYLLGKELYNHEVGLYAALFLSVSHWHVILTRIGFRLSTMPPVLALMVYFIVRGLKTGRRWFYALAGLFLGLGLYTYNAFMIVPLSLLCALVALVLAGHGRRLWRDWDGLLLLMLVAAFVFIPLGRYAYEEPEQYFYRAATRITSLEQSLPSNLLATFLANNRRALLMFNVQGDGVFVANVPYLRQLGFFSATLFALGAAYVLWRWRQGLNGLVLVLLFTMLLPTTLSLAFPHEVPNGGRAVGAIVPAMLLAGVALSLVRRHTTALLAQGEGRTWRLAWRLDDAPEREWHLPWAKGLRFFATGVLIAALAFEVVSLYPLYFREYVAALPDHNFSISLALAEAIDDFADDGEAYIKTVPYWYDGNAVRAQLRRADQSWHNEIEVLAPGVPPLSGAPGKFMIILHPDDVVARQTLQQAFPKGIELRRLKPDGTPAFYLFYGER